MTYRKQLKLCTRYMQVAVQSMKKIVVKEAFSDSGPLQDFITWAQSQQ